MKHKWVVFRRGGLRVTIEADDISMTSEGDISFIQRNDAETEESLPETIVLAIIHRDDWSEVFIVPPAGENYFEFVNFDGNPYDQLNTPYYKGYGYFEENVE